MRSRQRPTKREKQIGKCDPHEVYEHPAYGVIGMSVITGGDRHMFGSDIQHGQRIQISIQRAELHRNLSNDWVHTCGRPIVEVELSHSQFAEFITTPNRGVGIPCTITEIDGDMLPAIDVIESKAQMFRREIQESTKKEVDRFRQEIDRLGALITSGKTPKKELQDIHRNLTIRMGNMPSNMAFVVERAEEALEKAQTAAKIEIEATVNHHINRLGLDAARQIGLVRGPDTNKEIE